MTSNVAVTLRAGNKLVVNSTPVNADLTECDVVGYDAEAGTEADVQVQSLDSLGRGGVTYSFYDIPGEFLGWFDGNNEPVATGAVMIAPGEGLWASSPSAVFSIILPGVTL